MLIVKQEEDAKEIPNIASASLTEGLAAPDCESFIVFRLQKRHMAGTYKG
jgi:hypothetical protein